MKNFLLLTLLFITTTIFAQQRILSGKVTDKTTGKPLPFVNITVNGSQSGTSTDIDGNYTIGLSPGAHSINFSFIGYQKKSIEVTATQTTLNATMLEVSEQLQEASVFPGENPAHRIIRKAVEHKEKNAPENLSSFTYRTYSKFVATIQQDTAMAVDTVMTNTLDTASAQEDTSDFDIVEMMEKQHLFFMETVTERTYLPPSRDNETVLANRTSGFKNPLFSLLITQLQSFSFYGDYISIAGDDFLNPITKGSTKRYFFIIEDTTYNSPEDTVYVISYRPRPNYGFKPLKGVVYINTSDWAIQSVIAEPVENEGTRISIEQRYKPYAPHIWFPDQLSAEITFGSIAINEFKPVARVRTYLKDVQVGQDLKKRSISKAEVTIDELAVSNADKILGQYRVDSISAQEANTYTFMDSLSEAENLDKQLKILTTLATGKIPLWWVDLDLDKILSYNDYEGFRLGLGAHTNSRFSRWFKIGGYFGYGFGDEVLKYGWDTEIMLHKHTNLSLIGGYQFEIFESGAPQFLHQPNLGLLNDNYRKLFIPQWDETSRFFAGLTFDPLPNVHLKIIGQRENRYTVGNYWYNISDEVSPQYENGFNFFEVVTAVQYVPSQKFVEGPDFGKLIFEKGYPIVDLQYTRGISGTFDSEFDYDKIDLKLLHRVKTITFGISTFQLQGGTVLQDIPYSKLYAATANLKRSDNFWQRNFMIADRNSFETMRFNEFMSDTYVQFMFRQDFKSLLFRRKNFAPHVEVVARAMWGSLRSPDLHQNISTLSPEKGYYEAGIELNRLLSQNLLSLGIGTYYRIGPYSQPTFGENFAFKITSKYSL